MLFFIPFWKFKYLKKTSFSFLLEENLYYFLKCRYSGNKFYNLSANVLILTLPLKEFSLDIELGWQQFCFRPIKMSFHSLPSSVVSMEKSPVKQIVTLLKVLPVFHSTLGTLNSFHFVFSFQQFYYDVPRSHYLFIYPIRIHGGSWICGLLSFNSFGMFSALKIFLLSHSLSLLFLLLY